MDFYEQCWTSDEYSRTKNGYMQVQWGGKKTYAHRLSFFLHYGYWPRVCRHTCDVRACYNPTHLLDGTVADNNRDMAERGRAKAGPAFRPLNPGMPDQRADQAAYKREQCRRKRAGTWVYRAVR